MKARITLGIPCFHGVDFQVLDDYMRLAFYLGRRYQEYEFFLAIRGKSEQFRARNSIVSQALQTDSDFIWMLDDDHVIDVENNLEVNNSYEILRKLLKHMEENPKMGVIGALYNQRGKEGTYSVVMGEREGIPYFLSPPEISGTLQEVAVTGGGCMVIRREVFEKVKSPWFEAEYEWGTDVQICKKARKAGFSVWCDTSIEIGHQILEKEVIMPSRVTIVKSDFPVEKLKSYGFLDSYCTDVLEYTGKPIKELEQLAELYDAKEIEKFQGTNEEYYKNRGLQQLARNFIFNISSGRLKESSQILELLSSSKYAYGLDYCCGSAPIGFELALNGKRLDFVDIDGAESYEFVKWRAKKKKLEVGYKVKDKYDFVILMDALEHLEDWEKHLALICSSMKEGAIIVTNFFALTDYRNAEHVNMNKYKVEGFLSDRGILPINPGIWVKEENSHGKRSDFKSRGKD